MMTTQRNQYWLPEVFNDLFDNEFLTKQTPHLQQSMWLKKITSTTFNTLLQV